MIGSFDVQSALFSALKGANIAESRVYDAAGTPSTVVFPYVQIGETQPIKDDLTGRLGVDEYRSLHIWSRYPGQKELLEISAAIETALTGADLAGATGGPDSAFVYIRDLRTMRDPDGKTQHAVMVLRIQYFQPEN